MNYLIDMSAFGPSVITARSPLDTTGTMYPGASWQGRLAMMGHPCATVAIDMRGLGSPEDEAAAAASASAAYMDAQIKKMQTVAAIAGVALVGVVGYMVVSELKHRRRLRGGR